ncbi:MAG: creatininase family protein [Thermodesulfobacteriota bacterium]
MGETVLMEEMTWREIKEAIEQGKDTAILVSGSIEQHGPHLPTATDTIIGYATAEAVAKKLGNALVAPLIRPALSRHHIDFPGTIALRLQTFVKVLEEYCFCLRAHGFKKVVLFVSHGGNSDAVRAFVPSIAKKVGPDLQLLAVMTVEKHIKAFQNLLLKKGITIQKAGVHAGFSETSVMLMLRPDLVAMDKAQPGLTEEAFYQPENLEKSKIASFIHGVKSQSETGVLGDPTGSDAALGREIFEQHVSDLVEEIKTNMA